MNSISIDGGFEENFVTFAPRVSVQGAEFDWKELKIDKSSIILGSLT